MKIFKVIIFVFVLATNSYCSTKEAEIHGYAPNNGDDPKKNELSIMSYNVRHCSPPANPDLIDVNAIARIIKYSGAMIVGLQEIDVNNSRSGLNLDQAAKLGELTGMYFYFSKGINYGGGSYGTAILSRFPIIEQKTVKLPQATGTEQRTISVIKVKFNDKEICVANTHLDYSSDVNSLEQAKVIVETLKVEKVPVFITGDFNAEQNSATVKYLLESFHSTCESGCPPTFPADNPKKAIDFIFFSKMKDIDVKTHQVMQETTASDHRPIVAKLAW